MKFFWILVVLFIGVGYSYESRVRRFSIKEFACKKRPSLDFCSGSAIPGTGDSFKPDRFRPATPPPLPPRTRPTSGSSRRTENPFPFGTSNGRRVTNSGRTISEELGLGGPTMGGSGGGGIGIGSGVGVGVPGVGPIGVNSGLGIGAPGIGGLGNSGIGGLGLGNGGLFGISSGVGVSTPIGPIGISSGLGIGR